MLIQFEGGPYEYGAYILLCCLSLQNMLQIHQLLPAPRGQASAILCLDDGSGLPVSPSSRRRARVIAFRGKSDRVPLLLDPSQGSLLPSAQNPNFFL